MFQFMSALGAVDDGLEVAGGARVLPNASAAGAVQVPVAVDGLRDALDRQLALDRGGAVVARGRGRSR